MHYFVFGSIDGSAYCGNFVDLNASVNDLDSTMHYSLSDCLKYVTIIEMVRLVSRKQNNFFRR